MLLTLYQPTLTNEWITHYIEHKTNNQSKDNAVTVLRPTSPVRSLLTLGWLGSAGRAGGAHNPTRAGSVPHDVRAVRSHSVIWRLFGPDPAFSGYGLAAVLSHHDEFGCWTMLMRLVVIR